MRKQPGYWSGWVPHYWKNPMALKREGQLIAWMDVNICEDSSLELIDYAVQPDRDWFLPMLAEYARKNTLPPAAVIPAPLLPRCNGWFIERKNNMFRLNKPFSLAGKRIDTVGKLAAALSDTLFWETDLY